MREGDINILAGVGRKDIKASIDPGKPDSWRCVVAIPHVMEVPDILTVFEGEPVIRGKQSSGTERRVTPNDGFVAAELEHAHNVGSGEVEIGGLGIKPFLDGCGVLLYPFLIYSC